MDERVHFMFRSEMSSQAKPPLDGLAQEVLTRGRRARRARMAKVTSILVVAAGLVGFGVAMPTIAGSQSHTSGTQTPSASAASASPAANSGSAANGVSAANAGSDAILLSAASPVSYIPQPSGPKAPTTSAAVLDELLKLLPQGATSNYALYTLGAQAYLDGTSGLGMIRIHVASGSLNQDACSNTHQDLTVTCGTLPNGAPVIITRIPGNCIQSASIDVDHGHGTVVQVDLATCLAWNGTSNPPAPMAITVAEAEQIAANPAWGAAKMDAALVHDAADRFANVPEGS